MKKDKHFSFRCSQDDWDYIDQLAKSDDRTPSYVLNKMIKKLRERGVFSVSQINQMAKFDIGDKVVHKVFGLGTIIDITEGNSANLTIAFEEGRKVIKSSFVKLLK